MAITLADFTKIWASTSPLTPYSFSESNYKEGWNFIGGTPPARQMWDSIQKQNDEKMKYIVDNFLPLTGGTMTGDIALNSAMIKNFANNTSTTVCGGTADNNFGAFLRLNGKDNSSAGLWALRADDGANASSLVGYPNGSLTWDGHDITPQKVTTKNTSSDVNVTNNSIVNLTSFTLTPGTWVVNAVASFELNQYGYRILYISTTSTGSNVDRYSVARVMSVTGAGTTMSITTIMGVSANTTYYVNVNQNSGSTISVGGGVRYFRLSSVN